MATILASRIETLRRARGLSQRALAEAAGITRQAVGAIEAGGMQPGVGIALKLAGALDTTVEELFGDPGTPEPKPARVASATIGGRTVVHRLDADHLAIEPAESLLATVFVAGCELAAGLLSRHAMTRSRDTRVLWLSMTNRAALAALTRGDVHAAVVHTASKGARAGAFARFELAGSEAGWLAARGNPLDLGSARDLVRTKARLVNRPAGAGARELLDEQLRRGAIDPAGLAGYARELPGQLDAGRAVAHGFADAAIGMASVAHLFGLTFVPLREERLSLVVPPESVRTPEVRALLGALRSTHFRRDLQALETYDVARTGEQVA
jgi:molybdate-binding protein/transcriptional regulator with XRE-family HTH domain